MIRSRVGVYHWPLILFNAQSLIPGKEKEAEGYFRQEAFSGTLNNQVELTVFREGLFVFDFSNWSEDESPPYTATNKPQTMSQADYWEHLADTMSKLWLKRTALINSFLLCFYDAEGRYAPQGVRPLTKMVANPQQIVLLSNPPNQFANVDQGDTLAAKSFLDAAPFQPPFATKKLNAANRRPIQDSVIQESVKTFDNLLQYKGTAFTLTSAELLLRGIVAYESLDYTRCVTVCWSLIERMLAERWSVSTGKKSGKTPNAKKMLKELLKHGVLSQTLHDDLDSVRGARNNWMHNEQSIDWGTAKLAVEKTIEQLPVITNITIEPGQSLWLRMG